jgi:hypothetical protein
MMVLRLGDEILANYLNNFGGKLGFWMILIEFGQRFYLELGQRWNGQDCCYSWVFKQTSVSGIATRGGKYPMGCEQQVNYSIGSSVCEG